jgi:general secretion pathway protein E
VNIITVEDPVEYRLAKIRQIQLNTKAGMTFASGLRAILRQDPDIIMVGEIRDGETAQIAVQASLTGHLVLTTIHTNSAAAAVMRLKDMGVEPFLLASTLQAVLAQRLVRRLCPHCKQGYAPTDAECGVLGVEPKPDLIIYRAVGCEACVNTGYAGRLGLYELLQVTPRLRDLIHDGAREAALEAEAFRQSDTLLQSGARHVLAGETSLEDVLRVCRSEGPIDARL